MLNFQKYANIDYAKIQNRLEEIRQEDEEYSANADFMKTAYEAFYEIAEYVKQVRDEVERKYHFNKNGKLKELGEFLACYSVSLCHDNGISTGIFQPLAFEVLFKIVDDDEETAKELFPALFYPAISAVRLASDASVNGKKGGRPTHQRKDEALLVAKALWDDNPKLSITAVADDVYIAIKSKYKDYPSIASINGWLRNCGLKPE